MHVLRRRLLFLPSLLLVGCGAPTEESIPTLEFTGQIIFGIPTLPTVVTIEEGGLLVTGVVQTLRTGYDLHGTLRFPARHALRLEVDAYASQGVQAVIQHYYRAHLRPVAPGTYDVLVVHTYHDIVVRSVTAYHATVVMP
jgi:hypothetical protein